MQGVAQPGATPAPEATGDRDGDGEQWARWMLLAQDGDRHAYHALLQAVTPYLRTIARRYLGYGEDAEDAVQDVLVIVHGIRHTYERGRPFKPWLNTLASRRCIDLLRRRAFRLRNEVAGEDPSEDAASAGAGPADSASRDHDADRLHRAVAALPKRQREAIRLLRLNELSLREAAAASDQSIGSLKAACHRAIKSLRTALAARGSPRD